LKKNDQDNRSAARNLEILNTPYLSVASVNRSFRVLNTILHKGFSITIFRKLDRRQCSMQIVHENSFLPKLFNSIKSNSKQPRGQG